MYLDFLNNFIYPLGSLIVATLIGGEIVRRIYSPKVKVQIKGEDSLRNKFGFLTSLNIINLGSTAATNCIGYIIVDESTPISKANIIFENQACFDEYLPSYSDEKLSLKNPREQWITPAKYIVPKQLVLSWNHSGDPYAININPGVTVSLNICRMQYQNEKKFWYIIFPTEKGWRRVRLRMKYQNIKGKIFICPSNTHPLIVDFEIKFNKVSNEPILIVNPKRISKFQRNNILKKY